MDLDLQNTLQRISEKTIRLSHIYEALKSSKATADKRIEELEATILEQKGKIEKLETELHYLKIASNISQDRDSLDQTRAIISNLVREIDRCILDLKE